MNTIIFIGFLIVAFFALIRHWIRKAEFKKDSSDRPFEPIKLESVKFQSGKLFDTDELTKMEGEKELENLYAKYSDCSIVDFFIELRCLSDEEMKQYDNDSQPEIIKPARYEAVISDIFAIDEKNIDMEFIKKTLSDYFKTNFDISVKYK